VEQNLTISTEKVKTAVRLLYLSLGIGVLDRIIEASMNKRMESPGYFVFKLFFVFGIMWLNIFLIGRGLNWARIIFLGLFIIGLPFFVIRLSQSLPASPISGLLDIGDGVIQLVALVFLFHKTSSDWFREMKGKN
jgi:hypothetical protein